MKFIGTKIHAFLDYTTGLLLIASPWLFNFYRNGIESFVPIFLGTGLIFYSLFTNYEWSISKTMPLKVHLIMDVISGAVLALSPVIFGFADRVFLPHLIIGMGEIAIALCTKNTPFIEGRTMYKTQV